MMFNNAAADSLQTETTDEVNGVESNLINVWNIFIVEYSIPFLEYCLRALLALYTRLTLANTLTFVLKYVPTGYYMYKFIKDVYITSRERLKQKRMQMEDIQLQIQIIDAKLCAHDAEFTEREEQLRRQAERLRKMRARVHDLIAANEDLRADLESAEEWATDDVYSHEEAQREDRECLLGLLKEYKLDQLSKAERSSQNLELGEREPTESSTPEDSVYSSLSEVDVRQDCHVKIVKVTNVYKIAYLKHYIKQRRLRKAIKQALLKKKMETIKKLLEDWQKTLNMVINSKLTILNIDAHPIDVASQDAMGDYSKARGSSDSDSDVRNSWSDMCYDEYSLNWAQNPYKPYTCNYEDVSDTNVPREIYDAQDFGDGQYPTPSIYSDCVKVPNSNMVSIIEETNSQIAIEEIKNEIDDDYECHDLVVL